MVKKCLLLENETSGALNAIDFEAKKNGLDFYYKMIDCDCIDIVPAYGLENLGVRGYCLVVDDEGLLKEKPQVNPIASLIYGADSHGQVICGKALLCKNKETVDGIETVGLTDNDIRIIASTLNKIIDSHNQRATEARKAK